MIYLVGGDDYTNTLEYLVPDPFIGPVINIICS